MFGVRVHCRTCEVHAPEGRKGPGLAGVFADVPAIDDVLARRGGLVVEGDSEQIAALAAWQVVHGKVACAGIRREVRGDEVDAAGRARAG